MFMYLTILVCISIGVIGVLIVVIAAILIVVVIVTVGLLLVRHGEGDCVEGDS